jgi:hypothetical protein
LKAHNSAFDASTAASPAVYKHFCLESLFG